MNAHPHKHAAISKFDGMSLTRWDFSLSLVRSIVLRVQITFFGNHNALRHATAIDAIDQARPNVFDDRLCLIVRRMKTFVKLFIIFHHLKFDQIRRSLIDEAPSKDETRRTFSLPCPDKRPTLCDTMRWCISIIPGTILVRDSRTRSSTIDFPLPRGDFSLFDERTDRSLTKAIFETSYFWMVPRRYFSIVSSKTVELLSLVNWRICLTRWRTSFAWVWAWRKANWRRKKRLVVRLASLFYHDDGKK